MNHAEILQKNPVLSISSSVLSQGMAVKVATTGIAGKITAATDEWIGVAASSCAEGELASVAVRGGGQAVYVLASSPTAIGQYMYVDANAAFTTGSSQLYFQASGSTGNSDKFAWGNGVIALETAVSGALVKAIV